MLSQWLAPTHCPTNPSFNVQCGCICNTVLLALVCPCLFQFVGSSLQPCCIKFHRYRSPLGFRVVYIRIKFIVPDPHFRCFQKFPARVFHKVGYDGFRPVQTQLFCACWQLPLSGRLRIKRKTISTRPADLPKPRVCCCRWWVVSAY